MKLQAKKVFTDKETKDIHKIGDVLEVTDLDRINDLVGRGICTIIAGSESDTDTDSEDKITLFEKEFDLKDVKEALKTLGVATTAKEKAASVGKKIEGLTEEQSKALSEALSK